MLETAQFLYQQLPEFWLAIFAVFFCLGVLYAHATWRSHRRLLISSSRERGLLLRERGRAFADRHHKREETRKIGATASDRPAISVHAPTMTDNESFETNAATVHDSVAITQFEADEEQPRPEASHIQLNTPHLADAIAGDTAARENQSRSRIHAQELPSGSHSENSVRKSRMKTQPQEQIPTYVSSAPSQEKSEAEDSDLSKQDPKYFSDRYSSSD